MLLILNVQDADFPVGYSAYADLDIISLIAPATDTRISR